MTVKEITTGQDSFLDLIANLVGVIIILVVVIGAQAKSAWKPDEAQPDRSSEIGQIKSEISSRQMLATKMEADGVILESQYNEQVAANVTLGEVRHEMLVQIEIVERELAGRQAERLEKLDEQERQKLALLEEERRLNSEMNELQRSMAAVSIVPTKNETIDHFPNPIAKTVFTEEVHFQIRSGKIAYVPLEELLNRMKGEAKSKAEQLRQSPRVTSTIGPIQNFQLQYELVGETTRQSTPNGVQERTMIHFNGFQLIPSSLDLGMPVPTALDESGPVTEFRNITQRFPPEKTTVSLWVYPDSFAEYNQVKNWLYQRGYQVACWPLEHDKRISGSPSGFRTSAQ